MQTEITASRKVNSDKSKALINHFGMKEWKSHLKRFFLSDHPSDSFHLLFVLATVVLTWWWVLGWHFYEIIVGGDGVLIEYPYLKDFLQQGGSWARFLYRFNLEGGIVGHDAVGTVPIYQICAWLGLAPTTAINITIFTIQSCLGFLGLKAALDLWCHWKNEGAVGSYASGYYSKNSKMSWLTQVGIIWMIAFAPVVSWRIAEGHMVILWGTFAFVALFSMLLSVSARSTSLTSLLVASFTLWNSISSTGQQLVLYSALFGGIILIPTFLLAIQRGRFLAQTEGSPSAPSPLSSASSVLTRFEPIFPFLICLGVLCITFPRYVGMVFHALGSDGARSVNGPSVTYSYTIGSLEDWLSCIPWSDYFIPTTRDHFFWHEINYPAGPLLLLILGIPWKKYWQFGAGLIASAALAIVFSMNISPVSDLLLHFISPLNSFRVPERAILPFSVALPMVASAVLLSRKSSGMNGMKLGWEILGLVIGAVLCIVFPSQIWEIFAWAFVLIWMVAGWISGNRKAAIPGEVVILMLGVMSLSAFRARFPSYYINGEQLRNYVETTESQIIHQNPDLQSPLTRVHMPEQISVFSLNTPYALGLSTINGYWFPTLRFLKLALMLQHQPLVVTINAFSFGENSLPYQVLKQLYNLRYRVSIQNNQVSVTPNGPTMGPAWFSAAFSPVPNFSTLVQVFSSLGESLFSQLGQHSWIVQDDPVIQKLSLPSAFSPDCNLSKVNSVDARRGGQSVQISVSNHALCPLTVSMNYAETLHAYSVLPDGTQEKGLSVFPSDGTLTGILVPPGVNTIKLEATPTIPLWATIASYLGGIVLLGVFGLFAFAKR